MIIILHIFHAVVAAKPFCQTLLQLREMAFKAFFTTNIPMKF
jgi:hypothetical protein